MTPIIETKQLSFTYSTGTPFEKTAVKEISVSIAQGEFVGIIGHTGSGKSTLIQHFNGLLKPTSGEMLVRGKNIWKSKGYRRQVRFEVGLVFQYPEYQLFEETVEKDIAFGPKNMQLSQQEIHCRVLQAANTVGLTADELKKSPFELSGGQKRRAAIAGVIAMRPQVLVLDEPAAGLDPEGREMILRLMEQYHKVTGGTILLVSHNMEDIARLASRVLVMHQGAMLAYDTVEHIFGRQEKLRQIGLEVPVMTQVFCRLQKEGYRVCSNIYTVKQAKEEIERFLLNRGTSK